MPTYIKEALHKFQHPAPSRPQDAPHAWNQPVYGAAVQYADLPDDSPLLPPKSINLVQQIIGTLIYYAIAVDPTILVAIGAIASQQSKATQATRDATVWLLNYAASHPNATIRYNASDMVLHLHSDASYLSEPGARSRVGGHYFLSKNSTDPTKPPITDSALNSPIHTVSKILHNVMASAVEAEIGATFHNGQEAVPIRTTLQNIGHPQPPTPIRIDNSTAEGFANGTIKQKHPKPSICASIGSRTAPGKVSFSFIGDPAALTSVTISPSTTLLPITISCDLPTCTQLLSWTMH